QTTNLGSEVRILSGAPALSLFAKVHLALIWHFAFLHDLPHFCHQHREERLAAVFIERERHHASRPGLWCRDYTVGVTEEAIDDGSGLRPLLSLPLHSRPIQQGQRVQFIPHAPASRHSRATASTSAMRQERSSHRLHSDQRNLYCASAFQWP